MVCTFIWDRSLSVILISAGSIYQEPCHSGDDHKQTAQKESANGSSRNEEALLVAEAGRPLCFPVEPPSREHHPPSQHYRSCWASTEVDARNLKYKRHDCLEILYKYDDDWWLARKDDQVGLVQANRLIPVRLNYPREVSRLIMCSKGIYPSVSTLLHESII